MAPPSASRRGPGTRSGSSSGVAVRFVGMKEFRSELRKLDDRTFGRELSKLHREVAKRVAGDARSAAQGEGGPQAHFAAAIRGYGSATGARIAIADPNAFGAFWGAKQDHTGWNAGNKGAPNQPEWVGNSFSVGVKGEGPYVLNDTVADSIPWVEEEMAAGIERLLARAFPN